MLVKSRFVVPSGKSALNEEFLSMDLENIPNSKPLRLVIF
jgi:hypothetical protein